ncbi:glycosyltransferase family 1 protein [Schizophyllum amplum]|uniref:Glycosyltransferase family 1 protein n=1 Tax=Schizophyllum amplum TaxID=97359 RepID=A0A550CDB1_9AGAR|nr:glycosyltransferase family 1 protein [Auriculariopsis ampla]
MPTCHFFLLAGELTLQVKSPGLEPGASAGLRLLGARARAQDVGEPQPDKAWPDPPKPGPARARPTLVAFELHSRAIPGLEVHLASFPALRKRFERMRGAVREGEMPPTFHDIEGLPQFEGQARTSLTVGPFRHPPTRDFCRAFAEFMMPWTPEEYISIVNETSAVIERVDPHLIFVDTMFSHAMDACNLLRRSYHVLSPLLPSLVCNQNQPLVRRLFRYPMSGTGMPYPLPLSLIPANLLYFVTMIYYALRSKPLNSANAARAARGCPGSYPLMDLTYVSPERTYITPGVAEVDLPFDCPSTLHLCGPISADFVSLRDGDPELATWLDRGETVLMIMGTHFDYDEPLARRVLEGLLGGVDATTQILWKVPNRDELGAVFDEVLTTARDRDRVRAVTWFDAEPAAILEHENVVCYVHHGGANSYYECARAGKPQVVLAQWVDTYYNAVAAEYAGLGVYGNKSCAPDVSSTELSLALKRATSGEDAARMRERAGEVAVKCCEAGGRQRAADIVVGLLGTKAA